MQSMRAAYDMRRADPSHPNETVSRVMRDL
jgi:hypothetical protein